MEPLKQEPSSFVTLTGFVAILSENSQYDVRLCRQQLYQSDGQSKDANIVKDSHC